MSVKSKNREVKKILISFLISIPTTIGMIKVIENKWEVIFWTYMGIGTLSAIITRWYGFDNKKSKFLKTVEYIFWVSAITLLLMGIWIYFLGN